MTRTQNTDLRDRDERRLVLCKCGVVQSCAVRFRAAPCDAVLRGAAPGRVPVLAGAHAGMRHAASVCVRVCVCAHVRVCVRICARVRACGHSGEQVGARVQMRACLVWDGVA